MTGISGTHEINKTNREAMMWWNPSAQRIMQDLNVNQIIKRLSGTTSSRGRRRPNIQGPSLPVETLYGNSLRSYIAWTILLTDAYSNYGPRVHESHPLKNHRTGWHDHRASIEGAFINTLHRGPKPGGAAKKLTGLVTPQNGTVGTPIKNESKSRTPTPNRLPEACNFCARATIF